MSPQRLLQHFDRISEAPDAVARLRRFILDLAVRGKLVEQDPNDEPAAELLKRIQVVNERLIRVGKVREQKSLSTERDDTSVKLPSTWQSVQLAEIVYLRSGIAIEYGDDQPDGEIPYVKVSDLSIAGNNKGIFTSSRFIGEKYADSIIERGSIVFPKRGGAIATNRKRVTHVEIVCDSNLMVMRPFLHETSAFLQLWFSGFDLWQLNSGTSVPQINNKDIYPLFMPLPPLAEQHRIVAKVDELMVLCEQLQAAQNEREAQRDRLVAASLHRIGYAVNPSTSLGRTGIKEAPTSVRAEPVEAFVEATRFHLAHLPCLTTRPEHIKQLRQTILNLAVRGRLVPQDPNDELAVELLKRLGVRIAKSQTGADSQPIPAIWEWATIDQIAAVSSGTTPSRDVPEYYSPTGTPWVTSGETSNQFITQTAQHVSERALKETGLKLYPPGTLIVAMYGQGKTRGQISELRIAATTNQACAAIVLKLKDIAHRNYVKLYFQKIYEEIRELAAGGAQPNLNGGKIKSTLIPLPPLAEQHHIVAKVDELMALCDQLEAQLTTTQIDSCRLLEAVLRDALTPAQAA